MVLSSQHIHAPAVIKVLKPHICSLPASDSKGAQCPPCQAGQPTSTSQERLPTEITCPAKPDIKDRCQVWQSVRKGASDARPAQESGLLQSNERHGTPRRIEHDQVAREKQRHSVQTIEASASRASQAVGSWPGINDPPAVERKQSHAKKQPSQDEAQPSSIRDEPEVAVTSQSIVEHRPKTDERCPAPDLAHRQNGPTVQPSSVQHAVALDERPWRDGPVHRVGWNQLVPVRAHRATRPAHCNTKAAHQYVIPSPLNDLKRLVVF